METAEQHTSIAHSDGDTPRVDAIVSALSDYYDEWDVTVESFRDADPYPLTRYIVRFTRDVSDPEKIDPDERDVQEVFTESCGTAFDWTDGIASEWEPNNPCIPTIETIIRVATCLARPTPDQIRVAVYANCLGSSEVDDITKAIVSLFDAEVKL